jgi:lipopolysaccharide/colanic/teichoic acid biosynthesis glycosyltransferase
MTTFSNPLSLQKNQISAWAQQQDFDPTACVLYWRRKQLLVLKSQPHYQCYIPLASDEIDISERLKCSPVRIVRIDAALSDTKIRTWADACEKAGKTLYLRLPIAHFPDRQMGNLWWLKRIMDWSAAALLLMLLSPFILTIALLIRLYMPGPIFFKQWRVGHRGKLFKIIKFRTMAVDAEKQHHQVMAGQTQGWLHKRVDDPRITPLGRWLRRYSLDELPQLLNVLRGEMSLVGPRPWALYDAVRIRPEMRSRLNALPGITGAWQVEARSTLLDLDSVNHRDLEYLRNWSFTGDLKILLQTVPKVLSGFGAY